MNKDEEIKQLKEHITKLESQLAQYANEMMRKNGVMQMHEENLDKALTVDKILGPLYDSQGVHWVHESIRKENK